MTKQTRMSASESETVNRQYSKARGTQLRVAKRETRAPSLKSHWLSGRSQLRSQLSITFLAEQFNLQ